MAASTHSGRELEPKQNRNLLDLSKILAKIINITSDFEQGHIKSITSMPYHHIMIA